MFSQKSVIRRYRAKHVVVSALLLLAHSESASAETLSSKVLNAWKTLYARPALQEPSPNDAAHRAQIALGRKLFHDTRLSGQKTRSCATCHKPKRGFTDGQTTAIKPDGTPSPRNTPTLWNIRWAKALNWDGKIATLEGQAMRPIEGRDEMASSMATTLRRLNADPTMVGALPGKAALTSQDIVAALSAYEKTLISPPTRFDAWINGEKNVLTSSERAGFTLFVGKGGCARCHATWRFTDDKLHDIGLPVDSGRTAFKTPTLRELTTTAPYMHDGSVTTIENAVRHYSETVVERNSLSPNLTVGLKLTEPEIGNLVAFLKSLSQQ